MPWRELIRMHLRTFLAEVWTSYREVTFHLSPLRTGADFRSRNSS